MKLFPANRRWLPAVVVPVVVIGGALVIPAASGAGVDLPDRTPEQVLAMVGNSDVKAFSGTIEQASALGLPTIPTGETPSATGMAAALDLLTASHIARVYVDGPSRARVQVMDQLAERDFIANDGQAWIYSSAENKATHVVAPSGAPTHGQPADTGVTTPEAMAKQFLGAVGPTTDVTVGTDRRVAGRTAYELILTPRTSDTLVGSVAIAVDAETGLPLGVDVRARGQQDPAVHVAFTSLDLATPDSSLFTFTPPAGTTVEEQKLPSHSATQGDAPAQPDGAAPKVIGTGWSAIVEVPASVPTGAGSASMPSGSAALLGQLTQPVPGGRVISTALASVMLTDDGRILLGSVPAAALQAAAAG